MKKRYWSLEEKRCTVERMEICNYRELARELRVYKQQLYAWRKQLLRLQSNQSTTRERELERENQRLRKALANFLEPLCKDPLRRSETLMNPHLPGDR